MSKIAFIILTSFVVFILSSVSSLAETAVAVNAVPFSFSNEEISKVIETYAKYSGAKFIVDPGVRGRVTILNAQPVSLEEAFSDLSAGLALNGFAISKRENSFVVMSARNAQRSLVEVTTELPTLKPERMVTWVINLKHTSAESLNRDLRVLCSKEGELSVNASKNQLLITDWTANLHRVAEVIKQVDVPTDTQVLKLVEENKKLRLEKKEALHTEKLEVKTPGKIETKTVIDSKNTEDTKSEKN